ncbi:MAG: hypothetical protein KHW56_07860 [Clostridiales bacterium]|nr:hypothetical protein [Clostridiales bacterium]
MPGTQDSTESFPQSEELRPEIFQNMQEKRQNRAETPLELPGKCRIFLQNGRIRKKKPRKLQKNYKKASKKG